MMIRKAQTQDKEKILGLVKLFYGKSCPKMVKLWQKNYAKMSKTTFVCEVKNKIVAYISCDLKKDSIYIADLYVLRGYRRHGIAKQLVKTVEKLKKARGKEHLRVDVRKKDKAAVKFYDKLGFKFWKVKGKGSLRLRK